MAPANRAWIRSKMVAIKKASGIAFSEEIFLSILICLIAKNKHLVLHTIPETVPELKSIIEQHCAVVFGLTTATIVCHEQQTRTDIIGAVTGRHADIAHSSTPSSHYQFPAHSHTPGHQHSSHAQHNQHQPQQTSAGQYYQYSNPIDDYIQRSSRLRFEKSRRSIATNYSEASDYSQRPSEYNIAPSIASFKTASERDPDGASIQRERGHHQQETSDHSRGGDESSMSLRRSESRSKSTGDAMADHILLHRSRRSAHLSPLPLGDQPSIENISTPQNSGSSSRRGHAAYFQTSSHLGGLGVGTSVSSGHAPVTPVDFTFPRRRHESMSNTAGYGVAGEPSGVTYSGRRIAQAIILDGLENASQEVYATLMEMIINKEINDRNRYVFPDLIVIAVFNSPNIPDNIPKQLDWDELSKRMKAVTVSNDMTRYIRDVTVGIRTHEAVHGGLTARAALDLEAIMKTLAAIFQATFVTPDLLTIAAEKVFSHRLQLKSTRRQKMLAAAMSSSSESSPKTSQNGKAAVKSYESFPQHQHQRPQSGQRRKDSVSSEQSSEGGASFVEIPDSEEEEADVGVTKRHHPDHSQDRSQYQGDVVEIEDERTAADVVRDVLRMVYPPI
ncbi:hypothetical protein BGX28_010263 [Mortierella sp. GBA30]|nr:hypothetical protein BGX28_010263 [Mortierella sp. GBA30]